MDEGVPLTFDPDWVGGEVSAGVSCSLICPARLWRLILQAGRQEAGPSPIARCFEVALADLFFYSFLELHFFPAQRLACFCCSDGHRAPPPVYL